MRGPGQSFEAECERLGVEINPAESDERIGYGPSVGDSRPEITIPDDASYLAHQHELDHAKRDKDNGEPGMGYYMSHPDEWIALEEHAYGLEIAAAESDGYKDLADRLRSNLAEEVSRIEKFR